MHIHTVDRDMTSAGLQVAVEDVQQRAFSTTATAHDPDELAAGLCEPQFVQAHTAVGELIFNGISLEHDPRPATLLHESGKDVAVVDGCSMRRPHTGAIAKHIVAIVAHALPVQQHIIVTRVTHHVQVHAGHVQHADLPFQSMGMDVACVLHAIAHGRIDVEQVVGVFPLLTLSIHEDPALGEILLTDVEGLGHGGNEFRFLVAYLFIATDEFQQVYQHHELLALIELFVHLGADLEHLHGVERGTLAAGAALATTGVERLHESLVAGHVSRRHFGAELFAQETLQDGSVVRTRTFGHGIALGDDGEQLQ